MDASPFVPSTRSLARLAEAAAGWRGCPLRAQTFSVAGRPVHVTYHPSAALRADERAAEVRDALVADLRRARSVVHQNFS